MKVKNNIILALDVMNMKEATEICEKLEKDLDTIKIGIHLH